MDWERYWSFYFSLNVYVKNIFIFNLEHLKEGGDYFKVRWAIPVKSQNFVIFS